MIPPLRTVSTHKVKGPFVTNLREAASWKSFSAGTSNFLSFPPHCSHIFNGQELVGAVYSSLNVLSYNIPQFHKKLLHFLQKIIPRYFTFFLVVILNEIFFHCILH